MLDLSTRVAGVRLDHPLMNASGILGSSPAQLRRLIVEGGVSAVVTKSITPRPRGGYDPPILVELPTGGYLNAVGLENPGPDAVKPMVEEARRHGRPVIVSVAGSSPEDYAMVAHVAEEAGADAVELNLSCPHTRGYGLDIGMDPAEASRVVEAVSSTTRIPVLVKLGATDRVVEVAGRVLEVGARALTLINTVKAMYVDVYARRPVLTNLVGGLSGPPIHPIAVRAVYEVYREYQAEIVGAGGVYDWRTALELVLVGARALQVGSAIIARGLGVFREMLEGLEAYMEREGVDRLESLVGAAVY